MLRHFGVPNVALAWGLALVLLPRLAPGQRPDPVLLADPPGERPGHARQRAAELPPDPQFRNEPARLRLAMQTPDMPPPADSLTRSELARLLARSQSLIGQGQQADAIHLLQRILDNPRDEMIADPAAPGREQSVKQQAENALGGLPAQARRDYERQYGPLARRGLDQAANDRDLEQVVARYYHTQAGAQAAYRMASDRLDHGRVLSAAHEFERLRSADGGAAFEPMLSVKTAVAWYRAGQPQKALPLLSALARAGHGGGLALGGRPRPLVDEPQALTRWLAEAAGTAGQPAGAAQTDWPMFRGNALRNGMLAGGSPNLNQGWRVSTIDKLTGTDKDARLTELARDLAIQPIEDDAAAPVVPAFQPLVVGGLVVIRTLADVRAYDLATGQFAWASGEKDQPLLNALRSSGGPQANAARGMPRELLLIVQRLWQDLSHGTLSSDGQRIFVVEDLDLLAVAFSQRGDLGGVRGHNRLVAYDARSGKAAWEVGGPHTGQGDPLTGLYFLGPPLVYEQRLYILAEMGSEPVLVVLDPRDGSLELMQPLGDDDPVARMYDISRRMIGLTPSCDDGILVCPLGSDRVTAFDVARGRLLWSYRFRPRVETVDPRRQHFQMLERQLARAASGRAEQASWLDAGGVVDGARIWFTPVDSNDLVCLNLHDGTLAWKRPRGEALYLAGVRDGRVLLVGRAFVQALSAETGDPAWPQPIALPTIGGRGFFSDSYYVLPLARGEVAAIDTRDGRLVARTRSLGPTVIGNMVAAGGNVVSVSADGLGVFRQFEALEAEVVRALAANPRDARALALRGEMRLQRGSFAEAIHDLEQAVAIDPGFEEARELLFSSLMEGLRVDFARHRQFRERLEQLLATPEQRSAYHWLVANGLARAAERPAALQELLQFADPRVADLEFERVDTGLLVRRDRLVRARALELVAQAAPEELDAIRESLRNHALAAADDPDRRHLPRFLSYFGPLLNDASLARRALDAPFDATAPLSEEFRLMRVAAGGARPLAARATAQLAEALLQAGLGSEVQPLVERLEREFADVPCLDGLSGQQLVAAWRERRDLPRPLFDEIDWPAGRVVVSRQPGVGNSGGAKPSLVPLDGAPGPFFQRSMLELGVGGQFLQARDAMGRLLWKLTLESPIWPGQVQLNRVWMRDHLLLALVGNELLAIDRLGTQQKPGPRLLWQLGLVEGPAPGSVQRGVVDLRRRRAMGPVVPEQIGVVGPLSYDHVSYLRGRKLTVAEPLTGKALWVRDGVVPGSGLFGDDELLFVAPPGVQEALVFRTLDGSFEGSRRMPPAPMWLETMGRHIVLWGKPLERQILALRDAWTGQDRWSRDFAPGSAVAVVEVDEAIVLEPSGALTVVRMADGQILHQTELEPHANIRDLVALRTHDRYIVIANEPLPNAPAIPRPVSQQNIPVHGMVHALDRATGKRIWSSRVERQSLDPSQPLEWPVLTFASHLFEPRRAGNGVDHRFFLLCLDKRNGRILHEDSRTDEPLHFIEYLADLEARQLELRFFQSSVVLQFTDKPRDDSPAEAPQ